MSEYKLDYRLLQLSHVFNIRANMDIMYTDTISAQIHGEEWKINMILDPQNNNNENHNDVTMHPFNKPTNENTQLKLSSTRTAKRNRNMELHSEV